jgi:DNA-binding LytR/AlgR family response regulator
MTIKTIIVDDEQPARDELAYLLSCHDDIEIVGEADSASRAILLIKKLQPDLVFLDIQMPGKNGFQVISELMEMEKQPFFIFATAYDQYAIKAFEENTLDYIMKPFSDERIALGLDRVRKLTATRDISFRNELETLLDKVGARQEPIRISVEEKGRMHLLAPDDIVFCLYKDKRIMVHTRSAQYPLYGIATMDKLEKHLEAASFFRTHRVSLVNLNQIKEFSPWFNGKYNLVMADKAGTEIIVSRNRAKAFKTRLGI